MSTPETGGFRPEYQFGNDTIVAESLRKAEEIKESNMTPAEKQDAMQSMHDNFENILAELEVAEGN